MDHLVGLYTCKRKTRRWPMTLFFNLIDTAAVASYVLWCRKHQEYHAGKSHKRRLFLIELAHSLFHDHLLRRKSNSQAMQGGVKLAFKAIGFDARPDAVLAAVPQTRKTRCQICPRTVDRKTKTRCSECGNACCHEHSKPVGELCRDL